MAAWGRLRVLDGSHEGTTFLLDREVHTLGRGQASDFRLADPTVSRVQAEFRSTGDGVRISGLSDKNPVWVNGEPAGRGRPLSYGDKVQCGLVHLVFEEAPAEAPPAPDPRHPTPLLAVTTAGVSSLEQIPSAPASAQGHAAATPIPTPVAAAARGPACGRCGAKEAPGARFCGSCGAALSGSVPLPATSVTRTPSPGLDAQTMRSVPREPPSEEVRPRTETFGEAQAVHRDTPRRPIRTDTMARPPEALDSLDVLPGGSRGAPPPAPGSVLKGRFELRRHIAHGRVTEVYEAYDRETRATITVKVLLPALAADLEVRDWFFHAANALIVARHPTLLVVHSVHESGATCFSVSDYLAGVPLRDQIRARPASMGGYDPAEVRRVGTALCDGLAKLHEVGPHGDVVPGNVWIDPQGKVTLLDAGLSAVPGKAVRWPPTSDLAAAVYAAPEVLRGAAPDARSDLYAVGAVLYHMLTLDLPAGRILPVGQARPGIPPDLAVAVDRAMSPRPEDRFASAKDMHRFLTGELDAVRRTGVRKRWIAAAAAAAAAVAAASSAWWFPPAVAWRRKAFADELAVARADKVRGEALAAMKALEPLSEFTSAETLNRARDAVARGEAARDAWLPETAEGEFARALLALRQEEAGALEAKGKREELVRKAEARALELEKEIAHIGPAGAFFGTAVEGLRRRATAVAPSAEAGTVLATVEVAERRAALEEAARVAEERRAKWETFATTERAIDRARRDLAEGRTLLSEGRAAKAETLHREALARLRRAAGEEMEALLAGVYTQAGAPRPAIFEEARAAIGEAIFNGSKEDSDGAANAFDHAMAAFSGIADRAFEAVLSAEEAKERKKRCASCAGGGACASCEGSGRARVPCPDCQGQGKVEAPCGRCDSAGTVDCIACDGGTVPKSCDACSGTRAVSCSTCKGVLPACSNAKCREGRVACLYCKGGIVTAAGPDKGKPCTRGCDKGWNPCPLCKGAGKASCASCAGTGKESCKTCTGRGTVPATCPSCAGKSRVPCADCGGTRKLHPDCPKCEDGNVVSGCLDCAGRKQCPACSGRGRKE